MEIAHPTCQENIILNSVMKNVVSKLKKSDTKSNIPGYFTFYCINIVLCSRVDQD